MNQLQINSIKQQQRAFYLTGKTLPYAYRMEQLLKLKKVIIHYESEILAALKQDLNKSYLEGYFSEIGVTLLELNDTIKKLKKWMSSKKVKTPITLFKATSFLYPEPYGNVLIMAPWNYPFQLVAAPLIGALAAGNTAIIKMSPDAPHTADVFKKMIESIYPGEYVSVFDGGLEESKAILSERYDYIFFTGSTHVGKIVMEQASKHLTPVTLELGGKSPCIVDEGVDLKLASKRIAFGKFINAGQTCIAPDYIYVKESIKEAFTQEMQHAIHQFFNGDALENPDYPKIINDRHFKRLLKLMNEDKTIYGGKYSTDKIEPTLLHDITKEDPIMQEEIFGPLLPILTYHDETTLINELKPQEKPLALYVFSKNQVFIDTLIEQLSFGGATINDTIMHVASGYLPFGGVGASGMGSYHGKSSFDTVTHYKSVLKRPMKIDLDFRYHPYSEKKKRLIKWFIK